MDMLPDVTIGLPVYNGGDRFRGVLESILGQTFRDFVLLISDNASTDNTAEICKEYAKNDSRITYVRQDINLGAEGNFWFVFSAAKTKYFMWAAADDMRSSNFLEVNYFFLERNPSYLGSTCPVKFEGGDFDEVAMGDSSLSSDDPYQRVIDFFQTWHANGRFYSLFRRDAVGTWRQLYREGFLGQDWTLVTHIASLGKLNRATSGWVELGRGGVSNTANIFARYRKSFLDWLLPFNRVLWDTWIIMRGAKSSRLLYVTWKVIRLNLMAFVGQFRMMLIRSK